MKRIISIGFSTLMLLGIFSVLNIIPVMNVSANDPTWVVDHWETPGDWVIDASSTITSFTGTSINVNGNLTITPGYTLQLVDTTLTMNGTVDGVFNITVQSLGNFLIDDLDNNPLTPGDASVITGNSSYGFVVEGPNGYLRMENSELHECGWSNFDPNWEDAGLNIQGTNSVISGNDISSNFRGIIVHEAMASGTTIENNTIYDNQATGLWISMGSTNNHIANNEIYNNEFGIRINSSVNSQTNYIINNIIYENSVTGIIFEDSSDFHVEGNDILNHTGATGIYIWNSQGITVHDNYMDGNGGSGGVDEYSTIYSEGSTGIVITNNYITNSNQYGLRAQYQPDIVAENNQFINNVGGGAIVIFLEITNFGVVNNNTVSNAGWHGIFVDGCNNFKVTNNTVDNVGVASGVGLVNQNYYSTSTLKVYIYNNDVTNIGTGNNGVGMWITSGSDHVVDSNYFDTITSNGIVIEASDTLIQNNIVTNVGTSSSASNNNDVSGISLAGDGNVFINNTIGNCQSPGGTNPVSGLQFGYESSPPYNKYATNTVIKDSRFYGNEINVRAQEPDGSITNILIENSSLEQDFDTQYDFLLNYDAHITTLNTTFDNSSSSLDSSSDLTVKWYLNLNVKNGGSGQDGAEVRIQDIFGTDEPSGQPFTTQTIDSEPGWLKWIPLTEYIQVSSTKTFYTKHTLNATWNDMEAFISPNIWESQIITIDLNKIPNIVDLQRGASSVFRGETIYMFINATDVPEDNESEFVGEVQYRDPGNLFWNTTYLGSVLYDDTDGNPNNDDGHWYVAFSPPIDAPIGDYDFRARVQDTYGSWSDWEELLDSFGVNVKNNPPIVEDMYNITFGSPPPDSLYRGSNAWIYGDGYDVENDDDQNFMDADFEWSNDGGSTWEDVQYWDPATASKGGGDWYQNFAPPKQIDTPIGLYQFRVRFQDADGEWGPWESLEDLNILNNPPKLEDSSASVSEILRGDGSIRIYVNASDIEEFEQDLTVEFYYQHSSSGTGWEQTWLSENGWYDGISFYTDFIPPDYSESGFYKFWVNITDQYAPSTPGDTVSTDLGPMVKVLNNPPSVLDIKTSLSVARAGVDTVYIHVNASDEYNLESELKIDKMEWRKNNSASAQPPATPWENSGPTIDMNLDQGYVITGGGYIRGSMKPTDDESTFMGSYDIRLKIRDTENGKTDWFYLYNAFTAKTVVPLLFDITLQKAEIFRGETTYITLNASDLTQVESELTVEIYYKHEDDNLWSLMDVQPEHYQGSNDASGYWKIPFAPDRGWNDDRLGTYLFRARVGNDVPVFSNDGNYNRSNEDCEVKNNIPIAKSMGAEDETVERGSTIIIYAVGEDVETNPDDLDPTFKYSLGGSSWSTISDIDYNNQESRWEAEFTPDNDANLGDYSFTVIFDDGLDLSNELEITDIVEVTNAKPVATSLLISKTSAYRMDEIKLTAMVSDADQEEDTLIPDFQYQGPNDSDWVSQTSTTYFKNARYLGNNQWEITFSPPATADVGNYNFRVEFTDNAGVKCDPLDGTQTLALDNSEPRDERDNGNQL
jgi:parallel beta-helix repeat protein